MMATDASWLPATPDVVLRGCFMFPQVVPVYRSFLRLSRGRPVSSFGHALPLPYRDVRDEAARCEYEPVDHCETLITECDDALLKHYAEKRDKPNE